MVPLILTLFGGCLPASLLINSFSMINHPFSSTFRLTNSILHLAFGLRSSKNNEFSESIRTFQPTDRVLSCISAAIAQDPTKKYK